VLLLACAPLPEAVMWDASTGVTLGCSATNAPQAGQARYRINIRRIWFNRQLSKSTSVVVYGEYFDRSNSASSP
jgi:hypothetical protein